MVSGRLQHSGDRCKRALPPRGLLLALLAGCSADPMVAGIAPALWVLVGLAGAFLIQSIHQAVGGWRDAGRGRLADVDIRTAAALRRVDELQGSTTTLQVQLAAEVAMSGELARRLDRSEETVRQLLASAATRVDLDHLRGERADGDRALGLSVDELRARQERHEHELAELRRTVDGVAEDVHALRTDVDGLRTHLDDVKADTTAILKLLGART